jgi:hypothetical protein
VLEVFESGFKASKALVYRVELGTQDGRVAACAEASKFTVMRNGSR